MWQLFPNVFSPFNSCAKLMANWHWFLVSIFICCCSITRLSSFAVTRFGWSHGNSTIGHPLLLRNVPGFIYIKMVLYTYFLWQWCTLIRVYIYHCKTYVQHLEKWDTYTVIDYVYTCFIVIKLAKINNGTSMWFCTVLHCTWHAEIILLYCMYEFSTNVILS